MNTLDTFGFHRRLHHLQCHIVILRKVWRSLFALPNLDLFSPVSSYQNNYLTRARQYHGPQVMRELTQDLGYTNKCELFENWSFVVFLATTYGVMYIHPKEDAYIYSIEVLVFPQTLSLHVYSTRLWPHVNIRFYHISSHNGFNYAPKTSPSNLQLTKALIAQPCPPIFMEHVLFIYRDRTTHWLLVSSLSFRFCGNSTSTGNRGTSTVAVATSCWFSRATASFGDASAPILIYRPRLFFIGSVLQY